MGTQRRLASAAAFRRSTVRYFVPILIAAVSLLIRQTLEEALSYPAFVLFIPGIVLAAWIGAVKNGAAL